MASACTTVPCVLCPTSHNANGVAQSMPVRSTPRSATRTRLSWMLQAMRRDTVGDAEEEDEGKNGDGAGDGEWDDSAVNQWEGQHPFTGAPATACRSVQRGTRIAWHGMALRRAAPHPLPPVRHANCITRTPTAPHPTAHRRAIRWGRH